MAVCSTLLHRASTLDAEYVASHLQKADQQELDGLGSFDHKQTIIESVLCSDNRSPFGIQMG